jgi:oxygen-independent coproporphyrinogen-3 oxidase
VTNAYLKALHRDIRRQRDGGIIGPLKTLYIGGGTPSLLGARALAELIATAGLLPGAEITVESNPPDVTPEFLAGLSAAGVNRLSLGVQSLNKDALAGVCRVYGSQTPEEVSRRALGTIASHWKGAFSVDLIAGLPRETPESFAGGLEEVLSYGPRHISLYELTLEEGTPLARAVSTGALPYDDEAAEGLWLSGRDALEARGFTQYEASNFALEGCECRHNGNYWALGNYAAAGAGGTGTLVFANLAQAGMGDTAAIRYTMSPGPDYVDSGGNAGTVEELTKGVLLFEALMLGFRTRTGILGPAFSTRFGLPLEDAIGAAGGVFARWQSRGLAVRRETPEGPRYALTREGLLFHSRFMGQIAARKE